MDLANTLRTVYKTSDLIAWQSQGALDLSPFFQRRPVWKAGAKSYLIDSMVEGFPIPSLIFRDKPTNLASLTPSREVVDGQQRLRTVFAFVNPSLLTDYNPTQDDFVVSRAHNEDLAGKTFADLDKVHRQRILDYQFTAHIFPAETDDRDVLEVFARMNATGIKLNAQELRNAEFFGYFRNQAFSLATEQLNTWRNLGIFNDSQLGRMAEVEFTSELLILINRGVSEGSKSVITRFYRDHEDSYPDRKHVRTRFRNIMEVISTEFRFDDMPRLRTRSLLYPLFAAVYDKMYGLESPLISKRPHNLTQMDIQRLHRSGERLSRGTAPPAIQALTDRRMTHVSERKRVMQFLLEG